MAIEAVTTKAAEIAIPLCRGWLSAGERNRLGQVESFVAGEEEGTEEGEPGDGALPRAGGGFGAMHSGAPGYGE